MSDLELLSCGWGLVEGPRVDAAGNLYFSDVLGGGVRRLTPAGELEVVVPKRRGVGGIALHVDGGVIISGRDICHVRDGVSRTVLTSDALGFNDVFVDAAGRLITGTLRSDPFAAQGPQLDGEAWLIDLDGAATQLYGGIALTNGIALSPDGSVLYHADTLRGVWAHDYSDGAVGNRRLFVGADGLSPDGIAVDESGTVWVADFSGSGAVRGFAADGTEVGRVEVPAKMITSLCFGGADRRDLYVVTGDNTDDPQRRGSIFRTRSAVPGCAVALARL